jgi:hypothetical protein
MSSRKSSKRWTHLRPRATPYGPVIRAMPEAKASSGGREHSGLTSSRTKASTARVPTHSATTMTPSSSDTSRVRPNRGGQLGHGVDGLQHGLDQAVVVDQHARSPTKRLSACVTLKLQTDCELTSTTVLTVKTAAKARRISPGLRVLVAQYATPWDWSLLGLVRAAYDRDGSVDASASRQRSHPCAGTICSSAIDHEVRATSSWRERTGTAWSTPPESWSLTGLGGNPEIAPEHS